MTTAGVNLMAQDWTSASAALKLAKYHDFGLGTAAPTTANTILQTPATAIRAARVVGTQSNPVSGAYYSSGVMVFTGSGTITEWGLFTDLTAGTLLDRRTWLGHSGYC